MIFDTGNPSDPRKEAAAFDEEISDILTSLEGTRGTDYAAAVKNIFCSQNVHAGLLYIIAKVVQETNAKADIETMTKMVKAMEEDLIHDMAHLLIPIIIGESLSKGKGLTVVHCSAIVADLQKDVAMLVKKQDEYNLGAKGRTL